MSKLLANTSNLRECNQTHFDYSRNVYIVSLVRSATMLPLPPTRERERGGEREREIERVCVCD